jgi:hypothetical protein
MTQITKTYKGFIITETMQENSASIAFASFNGEPRFSAFSSEFDALTAYEKMIVIINKQSQHTVKNPV